MFLFVVLITWILIMLSYSRVTFPFHASFSLHEALDKREESRIFGDPHISLLRDDHQEEHK